MIIINIWLAYVNEVEFVGPHTVNNFKIFLPDFQIFRAKKMVFPEMKI